MPDKTKDIAHAMLIGIKLAYRNKLRESKRQVLEDLLDDMALALTHYAVTEKNNRIDRYAGILGRLLDNLDWPESIRPKRRKRND